MFFPSKSIHIRRPCLGLFLRRWKSDFRFLLACFLIFEIFSLYPLLVFSNILKWERRNALADYENRGQILSPYHGRDSSEPKLILFWTGLYLDAPNLKMWLIDEKRISTCPFNCQYTCDKSMVKVADGLIFHASENMRRYGKPDWRSPEQVYIMLLYESPVNTWVDLHEYRGFFNWTATYRLDSDIPYPYGTFENRMIPEGRKAVDQIIKSKTKMVAWLVSNCRTSSDRESYVSKLAEYVQVDIFGNCGAPPGPESEELNCTSRDARGLDCYRKLGKEYKFYLALENSLCDDYVTEKFFQALAHDMVPIVYGYPKAYSKFAPQNSYIDVMDFSTQENLAAYLEYLDKNDEEYSKYFEWRKSKKVRPNFTISKWDDVFCSICEKLHDSSREAQTYEDIYNWWNYIQPRLQVGDEEDFQKIPLGTQEICIRKKWVGPSIKDFWNMV